MAPVEVLRMPVRVVARAVGYIPRPRMRTIAITGACLMMMWGIDQPGHRANAARAKKPRAWFDAKGMCVFPLGNGRLPRTKEEFAGSLMAGWQHSLKFSQDDTSIVSVEGKHYPSLTSVRMQLAGGRMDLTKDNKGSKPIGRVESALAVRDFELDGRPLLCDRAQLNLHLTASQARLDMEHDERGRPIVMLSDARIARLDFQTTRADLERIVLISLREAGRKYGVGVDKVNLKLDADSPRSISLDLHLSTRVGFIPAGMRFQAHVDIDDKMNAKLSKLKCDGDEALGPLIVGLIRPGLAKYEGRSKPVFSFPTGQLKLHDIQIQTGDDVRVAATFGS